MAGVATNSPTLLWDMSELENNNPEDDISNAETSSFSCSFVASTPGANHEEEEEGGGSKTVDVSTMHLKNEGGKLKTLRIETTPTRGCLMPPSCGPPRTWDPKNDAAPQELLGVDPQIKFRGVGPLKGAWDPNNDVEPQGKSGGDPHFKFRGVGPHKVFGQQGAKLGFFGTHDQPEESLFYHQPPKTLKYIPDPEDPEFPASSTPGKIKPPSENTAPNCISQKPQRKDVKALNPLVCGQRKVPYAPKWVVRTVQVDPTHSTGGDIMNPSSGGLTTKDPFLKITGQKTPRDEKRPGIRRIINNKLVLTTSLPPTAPQPQKKPHSKIPVQSTKPRTSTVRIANYRPNYTWNRGGRLKEIRIRYLARKFTFIWKRKVFGRLSPALIRSHWRLKALSKYFDHWHTISWHAQREWRLLIRADCHHRFWLKVKIFRAWTLFVTRKKQKKFQAQKSQQFYNQTQLERRFLAWKLYVVGRQKKSELSQKAVHFNQQRSFRNIWQLWQSERSKVKAEEELTFSVDLWRKRRQQKLTLQKWSSALCAKEDRARKLEMAARHRDRRLGREMLMKWSDYVQQRRRKYTMKIGAKVFSESSLTCRAFGQWTAQFRRHQTVYRNMDRFHQLQQRLLLRQMWAHWTAYISNQRQKKWNCQKAEFHHRQKLLFLGFAGFQLHFSMVRSFNHLAEQLWAESQRLLLRKCFLIWVHKFDLREEMRQQPLTIKALQFHRFQLLKKSFRKLKHYVSWRHHRQTQYAKAEAHFYVTRLPTYVQNWKLGVDIVKRQKRLKAKAQEYWQENTKYEMFYTWQEATSRHQEYQQMELMAVLHYDKRLLQGTYGIWHQRTSDCLKQRLLVDEAENYFQQKTLRRFLLAWKQYVNELHDSRYQNVISLACYYGNLQRRCFSAWGQFCKHRQEKSKRLTDASDYHKRILSVKVWITWRRYVTHCRQISRVVEEKHHKVSLRTLRWAFHIWHDNSHEASRDRKVLENTQRYFNQRLLAKVLGTWRNFAAVQAYKKSQIENLVLSVQNSLQTGVVHRLFIRWRHRCHESIVDERKELLATSHRRCVILQQSFLTWKLWLMATYKKKLLVRQSLYFRHQVVLVAGFNQWMKRLYFVRQENRKTQIALWHWSLNLQQKTLLAWKAYHCEQLRKRERISSAIAARRERLLREGLQCWISAADQLAGWRKTRADQQQTQSVVSTFNNVRRFAQRWHQKTIAGRSQRMTSLAPPVGSAKPRPFGRVFPKFSTGDPSISCFSSDVVSSQQQQQHRPVPRPQPLYPSFLDESSDVVAPQHSNSEFGVEIPEAATKEIPKQVPIENPFLDKQDLPTLVEGPMEPLPTPKTLEVTSDRIGPNSLEMPSPKAGPVLDHLDIPFSKPGPPHPVNVPNPGPPHPVNVPNVGPPHPEHVPNVGPPQPMNVQSGFETFLEVSVPDNPEDPETQKQPSDILLMTPNDFQVSKMAMARGESLRSEVIDTRHLLLEYQAQRQKLSSLKEYLNKLRSWEQKKDPNLSSLHIELSQTEADICVLRKSLQEQKNQLKARVEKLTHNPS